MYEDRVFVGWKNGCFVTTAGPNLEFQRQLTEMVADLGPPDKVEFRPANEGFTIGGFDLEDNDLDSLDSATDIIPLRQALPVQLEDEEDDESAEYCAPV